jgi:hypothetical protein
MIFGWHGTANALNHTDRRTYLPVGLGANRIRGDRSSKVLPAFGNFTFSTGLLAVASPSSDAALAVEEMSSVVLIIRVPCLDMTRTLPKYRDAGVAVKAACKWKNDIG